MPETDVQTPAQTQTPAVTSVAEMSYEERSHWRNTGETPADVAAKPTKESKAESGASLNRSEVAPGAGEPSESQIEPSTPVQVEDDTAKSTKTGRTDMQARLGQETERKKAAIARAEAAERRIAELEAKGTAPAPQTASEIPVQPAPTGKLIYQSPKGPIDFTSGDEELIVQQFVDAGFKDGYAALSLHGPKAALQFHDAEQSAQRQHRAGADRLIQTVETGRERHADWDDVMASPELAAIRPSPAILHVLHSTDDPQLRADVLYHLGKNPAEVRRLAAMEPVAAAKELGKLESKLSGAPSRPATKTLSDAPPPPDLLGTKHSSGAKDDLEEAEHGGDYRRYRELRVQRMKAAAR